MPRPGELPPSEAFEQERLRRWARVKRGDEVSGERVDGGNAAGIFVKDNGDDTFELKDPTRGSITCLSKTGLLINDRPQYSGYYAKVYKEVMSEDKTKKK